MKVNILKYTIAAVAAVFPLASAAQNLDPTVVVNRAYEGKLLEVHKPAIEMAVPDSVKVFDLDFDYSVFENPYKGSYEFKPYQLLLKPVSSDVERSKFWLNAGAGYSLYPELDLVWTPVQKGAFKMNVYADYGAYFGKYRTITPQLVEGTDNVYRLDRTATADGRTDLWNGYRMSAKAGVDGRYDWEKSAFVFDLGYYGVSSDQSQAMKSRFYNAFDVKLDLLSKPRGKEYFHYDLGVDYRYGNDRLDNRYDKPGTVSEHDFSFDATMGSVLSSSDKVLFDLGFDALGYSGALEAAVSQVSLVPHYVLRRGAWNLDLGLRLAKIFRINKESHCYNAKEQVVYPAIKIKYYAVPDALAIYFNAEGGNTLDTYSSMIERNNFVAPDFAYSMSVVGDRYAFGLLDATVERVALKVGLDGRISKRFSYDVHGGCTVYASGLLDAVIPANSGTLECLPGYGYASYSKIFVGLDWNWHAERIAFDGSVTFTEAVGLEDAYSRFAPAAFTGDVELEYNWNKRVYAGMDCVFSTARKAAVGNDHYMVLPGFADLGVYGEYVLNRKISFWLRGGNLMNMTVQYSPLYAERGINFTAGIRLKL